ncbi:DUF3043 domain-containing protein [Actinopolyspora erythraea]|uniref:DUF3043 domain-containing protein n=1 Tax=Actinopolyspora erythraea TaxID=414996 RepID=A0A099D4H1_9ACTN|nr:DUF3043 domain-containing protein [Actinopolyspora erythraea]ASU79574.1 DUF3043 domain-containing protein [Actinopolyspora erythraea]KGI81038.1 hypothetical protein IL38_13450 [Actinopolyspora erythraea]
MKFLRRNTAEQTATVDADEHGDEATRENAAAPTRPKGRPTPKRRESEGKRRGPVPPPPRTQREAFKRMRRNKPERRKAAAERRERMMAGDDRYLMPRDRGPVRAHVRDIVDSRRHLMGLFMPLVLVVFAATLVRTPLVQQVATVFCLALLVTMIFEGTMLGRLVTKRVRAKFPDARDKGISLGWYAFTRAMQLRKLRVPRPRVTPKDINQVG